MLKTFSGAILILSLVSMGATAEGDHAGNHHGNEHPSQAGEKNHHDHHPGHGKSRFDFGAPGQTDKVTRTIAIRALDSMRFDPESVKVKAGETIRFEVRNTGEVMHSFVLGPPAYQHAHEKEMQGMPMEDMAGHMKGSPNGVVVPPGEARTLVWHFSQPGKVSFACHVPGHFEAGMEGRIRFGLHK